MKLIPLALMASAIILVIVFIWKLFKTPPCECRDCGWLGDEDDLDIYSSEAENSPQTWFFFCPECGSGKLIHEPKLKYTPKEVYEV